MELRGRNRLRYHRARLQSKAVRGISFLLCALAFIDIAQAQRSTASCTSEWAWANNKERQSPCDVAAQLLSLCDSSPSTFTLSSGERYAPSAGAASEIQPNTCACNVVVYNLLMACQACQRGSAPADIPSWAQYGEACSICSTENGISPGPCAEQSSPGFPASVKPQKGSIGVPSWAYDNTSKGTWNAVNARRSASPGDEKAIAAPAPPSPIDNRNGEASSTKTEDKGHQQSSAGNNTSVIVCICLATMILLCFLGYLLRLCYVKRKARKMKEYNDSVFDKVIPAKKETATEKSGVMTPLKLNFKNMLSRLTIAMPKTPRTPRTPNTPGMADLPCTPLTARFWTFHKRDTKKLAPIAENEETEALAEKTVRFEQPGESDRVRRKVVSRRCDSVASTYSVFDSYKSSSSLDSHSRPSSSTSDLSSQASLVTGSVKSDRPKLREANRINSVQAITSGDDVGDRDVDPRASDKSQKVLSKTRSSSRVQSSCAKVSEWSDTVSNASQESRKSSKKSVKSRSSSMSEVDTRSSRQEAPSGRPKSQSKSGSRGRNASFRPTSNVEGDLSDSDQPEMLKLQDDSGEPQKKRTERHSVASSAPSSTLERSTKRMNDLLQSVEGDATPKQTAGANEAEEDRGRDSVATVSSDKSNLRRLDSIIGQLEFDEMMSAHGSPTKKSWLARASTKSGRSVPPPSPALSSAPGFAM